MASVVPVVVMEKNLQVNYIPLSSDIHRDLYLLINVLVINLLGNPAVEVEELNHENQINKLSVSHNPVVVVVGHPNDRPVEPGVVAKYTYHYFD